jgi:hypothetical protein
MRRKSLLTAKTVSPRPLFAPGVGRYGSDNLDECA